MISLPNHVNPGDLITAQFINDLIDQMEALDIRITNLENGNKVPMLFNLDPKGDVAVGSKLTLNGRNFLMPPSLNFVEIGSVKTNAFIEGTNEALVMQVPDLFNNLPDTFNILVSNTQFGKSNSLQVHITKGAPNQGGNVTIIDNTPALGQINIGTVYQFKYSVVSNTLQPATYNIAMNFASLDGTATLAAWQANTTYDPTGPQLLTIGHPLSVTVSIKIPDGAKSADVSLMATSQDQQFSQSSSTLKLLVGQTTVTSDPRAQLTLPSENDIPPLDSSGKPNPLRLAAINSASPNGFELKFGTSALVPINGFITADQTAGGTYNYSASVETPAGLWTTGTVDPPSGGQNPSSSLTLQVPLTNTDTGSTTTVKFLVVQAAHQKNGATDFVSFTRFPIRGYSA